MVGGGQAWMDALLEQHEHDPCGGMGRVASKVK